MGEASRRKRKRAAWPKSGRFDGEVGLYTLAPDPSINGTRINELTGDEFFPPHVNIIVRAFRAVAGEREF